MTTTKGKTPPRYIHILRKRRPGDYGDVMWCGVIRCGGDPRGIDRAVPCKKCDIALAVYNEGIARKHEIQRTREQRADRASRAIRRTGIFKHITQDPDYVQPTSCYAGRPGVARLRQSFDSLPRVIVESDLAPRPEMCRCQGCGCLFERGGSGSGKGKRAHAAYCRSACRVRAFKARQSK